MSRRERLDERRRERFRALLLVPVKLLGILALTLIIFTILLIIVVFALSYWFPGVVDWLVNIDVGAG